MVQENRQEAGPSGVQGATSPQNSPGKRSLVTSAGLDLTAYYQSPSKAAATSHAGDVTAGRDSVTSHARGVAADAPVQKADKTAVAKTDGFVPGGEDATADKV